MERIASAALAPSQEVQSHSWSHKREGSDWAAQEALHQRGHQSSTQGLESCVQLFT